MPLAHQSSRRFARNSDLPLRKRRWSWPHTEIVLGVRAGKRLKTSKIREGITFPEMTKVYNRASLIAERQ